MEFSPEAGIPLQPVFIVGFQPVDLSVLENQESNAAVHFLIVFKAANFVILVQAVF